MDPSECPRCRKPLPADAQEKLGGLCLPCLGQFVLAGDGDLPQPETPGGAPAPPHPLEIDSTFEGLRILEFIARGGMGFVYKALQIDLGRTVALKVLAPELADAHDFAQRFNGEARALALLSHSNIVQIFDFGRRDNLYYLVMEYVQGVSLRELIQERRLGSDEILGILSQVCGALEYAHFQGVVHRDIKPENILVDSGGRVKIADFGLAKILKPDGSGESSSTHTAVLMGTPQYMAPEQSDHGHSVDHRADIYALGVILYELLTGAPPQGLFHPPSRRAPVDERLDRIVIKALERAPEKRYQRASELKTDLDAVAKAPRRAPRTRGRQNAVLGVLVALALGGIGIVWGSWPRTRHLPPDRPIAVPIRSWQWENPAPGSRTEGDDLVFTTGSGKELSEAVPQGSLLGKKFRLAFRYRYQIEPKQEPWLFLIMEAAPGSGHERNALVLFPESGHTIHFASRVTGKGWGLRDWRSLPEGTHGAEQWFEVVLSWENTTKRLRVTIEGKEVFNAQLGAMDTLSGVWSFGLGGSAKELRIRDVTVTNEP